MVWQWASSLSRLHQVWVISGENDPEGVSDEMVRHPNPNLSFTWVAPPRIVRRFRSKNNRLLHRLRYLIWLRQVLPVAKRLHKEVGFDLVHHVSFGTIHAASPLWRLGLPTVWGPLGGGQKAPRGFESCLGGGKWSERVRNALVSCVPFRWSIRKAAQRSALVLAANRDTRELLSSIGARHVEDFLDTGILAERLPSEYVVRPSRNTVRILWVGTLEAKKCFPLAISAVEAIRDCDFELLVAGDGPLRRKMEEEVHRCELDQRTRFLGRVSYDEVFELYRRCDIFLFTSIRDTFGAQVMEAMSQGLPVVTLNHQGVGTFLPDDAAIKVPVVNADQTGHELGEALRRLVQSPELRAEMGRSAWKFGCKQEWSKRTELMSELYQSVVPVGAELS
jgi:glycosyltransferase involved in cell wall biosynthesis